MQDSYIENSQSFLEQVLQKIQTTIKSEGNLRQEVYPLLEDNLDKLNDNLAKALGTWEHKLKAQSEETKQIARYIALLSQLILYFPLGSKASNTEIAIAGYKVAQTVYTRENFPEEWASIQHELGYAYYTCRRKGETAENQELAIEALQSALEVWTTSEDFLKQWIKTQKLLSITYCYRIRGDKADNLEVAIDGLESALPIAICNFPEDWASIKNELGYAYQKREEGGKSANLEAAINAFKLALEFYTRDKFSEHWAITKNNLGHAYLKIKNGDKKDDNVKLAIECFNSALEIFSEKEYPGQWVRIQNNLGTAYLQTEKGDQQKAIQVLELALRVVDNLDDFLQEFGMTQANLAYAYQKAEKYPEAYNAYASAINIAESLRKEIIFGSGIEADKQKLAEDWNHNYQGIVEVCLELANANKDQLEDQLKYYAFAIEYAERSQARNLVELLENKNLYPKKEGYNEKDYEEHCKKLDKLRREISSKQRQKVSQKELKVLQDEQDKLLEEINKVDSSFKFTQQINPISFSEIQDLVKENTAIIKWYITNAKIITFIITCDKEGKRKQSWRSSSEGLGKLLDWYDKYFQNYYELKTELTTLLQNLAGILDIKDILSDIPKDCSRLILVPHRFLHLFPLHALPFSDKPDECLLDKFQGGVGYAASCQLLQISQKQQRTQFTNLFAVQNPTNNLHHTKLEVDAIRSFFSSDSEVLEQENASVVTLKLSQKLPSSHCCHFSCHGEFKPESPLESALLLAEHKESNQESEKKSSAKDKGQEDGRLTLAEIFGLNLGKCCLVTLSACETGMVDPDSISDEYIGLPSGFLFAGTPSVVASLWKVGDISTALLMIKFYENLTQNTKNFSPPEEGAVAIALNEAQRWLRGLTRAESREWIEDWTQQSIEEWIKNLSSLSYPDELELRSILSTKTELEQWKENLSLDPVQKMRLQQVLHSEHQGDEQPFCQPYHWAAFCAIGQ